MLELSQNGSYQSDTWVKMHRFAGFSAHEIFEVLRLVQSGIVTCGNVAT